MNDNYNQNDIDEKLNSFKTFTDDDADNVLKNEKKIMKIVSNETLAEFLDTVTLFFEMLKDYFSGKYREVPVGTIAAILGSLAYVLCPVDLIPDFIVGVGYLDDAAIITGCISLTKYDVQKYKEFKKRQVKEG